VIAAGGLVMIVAVGLTTFAVLAASTFDQASNSTNHTNHTNQSEWFGPHHNEGMGFLPQEAAVSVVGSISPSITATHITHALAGTFGAVSTDGAPAWTVWLLGVCMCLWGAAGARCSILNRRLHSRIAIGDSRCCVTSSVRWQSSWFGCCTRGCHFGLLSGFIYVAGLKPVCIQACTYVYVCGSIAHLPVVYSLTM
jgi:hypothetical protein